MDKEEIARHVEDDGGDPDDSILHEDTVIALHNAYGAVSDDRVNRQAWCTEAICIEIAALRRAIEPRFVAASPVRAGEHVSVVEPPWHDGLDPQSPVGIDRGDAVAMLRDEGFDSLAARIEHGRHVGAAKRREARLGHRKDGE